MQLLVVFEGMKAVLVQRVLDSFEGFHSPNEFAAYLTTYIIIVLSNNYCNYY